MVDKGGVYKAMAGLGYGLLVLIVGVGLIQSLAAKPGVDGSDSDGSDSDGPGWDEDDLVGDWGEIKADGRPVLGKWRVVKDPMRMTEAQRAVAAELEAIGYADGTREVDRGTSVVPIHDPGRAMEGVNLYHAGHEPIVYLTDMRGEVLYTWETRYERAFGSRPPRDNYPGTNHPRRVALGEDGEVYYVFEGRGVTRVDKDGHARWGELSGAHHDVALIPDDRIAVLERKPALHEAINKHTPVFLDEISIRERETGREVQTISLVDALLEGGHRSVIRRRQGDLLHTNSLRRITEAQAAGVDHPAFVAGHYLVSMRTPSAIGIVDPDAQVFTWVHRGAYRYQHEAELNDDGELALFDNLGGRGDQSWARVFDAASMAQRWTWGGPSKQDRLFSPTLSVAHLLDNGNVLVVESEGGRAFEVTRPEGDIVWQMHNPHRAGPDGMYVAALFDVVRYRRDDPKVVAVLGPAE